MLAGEVQFVSELTAAMKSPRLRTMAEFAEAEIVLPDGPFAGRRFRLDRSPVARLWFSELDSGNWKRFFLSGINQDGKSLLGFVIPTMYLLFERKETVILGVPSLDMVRDKWQVDILPAINASRYRDLLPTSGSGSRGGDASLIQFKHGVSLRFMTAGGDDQSRAAFTSSRLVVTETDGFDEVGGNSREGDKFSQLERRLLAYGDQGRTIAECTVSTEAGRTWQEIKHGTDSRIAIPCPHCGVYVTPEREHLHGWQDAEDEQAAIANAFVCCPNCGAKWTNAERVEANHKAVLVHKGQEVTPDGEVVGPLPKTNTLGLRWNVINCILNKDRVAMVAGLEWKARRAADEEVAERDLLQSQWALPAKPEKLDISKIDYLTIMARSRKGHKRGELPEDTIAITVGCDVGKRLCHWTAIAWGPRATPHVIEYDRIEVPQGEASEEDAILLALRNWYEEVVQRGWNGRTPAMTFVDAGNWRTTVIRFCEEAGCIPTIGYGIGQDRGSAIRRESGSKVIQRYDHFSELQLASGSTVVEVEVDYWKSWLHGRMRTPLDKPSAFTLFTPGTGQNAEHLTFAKHLTAEKQVEEFIPGKGTVTAWQAVSRNNHFLDSTTLACVAGNAAGVRLIEDEPEPVAATPPAVSDEPKTSFLDSYRGRY